MTGPIKPGGSPLAISEINTGFALGDNLGVYRGVNWYYSGNLTTGTFPSGATARLDIANFYGKQPTDPATAGTTIIDTVGSGSFVIPLYRNTLKIELWGGGGGGGGGDHDSTYNGSNGTLSTVLGVNVGGGMGGVGGFRYGAQSGAGGSGGIASGTLANASVLTKTTGNAGGGGNAGGNTGVQVAQHQTGVRPERQEEIAAVATAEHLVQVVVVVGTATTKVKILTKQQVVGVEVVPMQIYTIVVMVP